MQESSPWDLDLNKVEPLRAQNWRSTVAVNVTLELNVRVWPTVIKTGYLANGMQND
jgi:hypothetical protein